MREAQAPSLRSEMGTHHSIRRCVPFFLPESFRGDGKGSLLQKAPLPNDKTKTIPLMHLLYALVFLAERAQGADGAFGGTRGTDVSAEKDDPVAEVGAFWLRNHLI